MMSLLDMKYRNLILLDIAVSYDVKHALWSQGDLWSQTVTLYVQAETCEIWRNSLKVVLRYPIRI